MNAEESKHNQEELRKHHDLQMKRDYDALRCTVLTEMYKGKWRIHGFGPRKINDNLQLVSIVKEYDKFSDMTKDLPSVVDSFYSPPSTAN